MDSLVFFSRSADVAPGRGKHERVADSARYVDLAKRRDWRKMLSNFHVAPFVFNGKTYNTIEHGFQAAKIALVDPAKARQFALESDSELSRGDGLAARRKRKMVVLTPRELVAWGSVSDAVMHALARAKFAAHPDARDVLLATGDAELWHQVNRGKPVRFYHLELVRSALRRES